MTTALTLPIARLRAAGCKVATTLSHNGHDWTPASERKGISHRWEYVITLPQGVRIPVRDGREAHGKATLRTTVQSNALVAYSYDRDAIAALLLRIADILEGKQS